MLDHGEERGKCDVLALAAAVNQSNFLANARRGARDDDSGARCETREERTHKWTGG